MKPTLGKYYEVPNGGQPVKTLAEWKRAAVFSTLAAWKDSRADELSSAAFEELITEIIGEGSVLVEILSQVEKGRPRGSKMKKKSGILLGPTATDS